MMTAYEKYCRDTCELCAKGIPYDDELVMVHDTDPDGEGVFHKCAAPTLAQFSEHQAAEIARLKNTPQFLETAVETLTKRAETAEGYLAELSPRYKDIVAERGELRDTVESLTRLNCALTLDLADMERCARDRQGDIDRIKKALRDLADGK